MRWTSGGWVGTRCWARFPAREAAWVGSFPGAAVPPSPLAGEGRGEGVKRAQRGRKPPLPNPSPARGEGLVRWTSGGWVGTRCWACFTAREAAWVGSFPGAAVPPSPLAGEGRGEGAKRVRCGRKPPLPNPSPARGEGLERRICEAVFIVRAARSTRPPAKARGCSHPAAARPAVPARPAPPSWRCGRSPHAGRRVSRWS